MLFSNPEQTPPLGEVAPDVTKIVIGAAAIAETVSMATS